jgi:hypothetical protein
MHRFEARFGLPVIHTFVAEEVDSHECATSVEATVAHDMARP